VAKTDGAEEEAGEAEEAAAVAAAEEAGARPLTSISAAAMWSADFDEAEATWFDSMSSSTNRLRL
jgi:hypothetical protein